MLMIPAVETETFTDWLRAGDAAPVGEGVSELRLMFGPGYRVYYAARGSELIVLLAGGDKGTQAGDIETAKKLWREWKEENNG